MNTSENILAQRIFALASVCMFLYGGLMFLTNVATLVELLNNSASTRVLPPELLLTDLVSPVVSGIFFMTAGSSIFLASAVYSAPAREGTWLRFFVHLKIVVAGGFFLAAVWVSLLVDGTIGAIVGLALLPIMIDIVVVCLAKRSEKIGVPVAT